MPSINSAFKTSALASLLLLIDSFTLARDLTFDEVQVGKVDGFTGSMDLLGYSSYHSDHLISTFCFCEQPDETLPHYGDALYFQFEYYHYHGNSTYILNHLSYNYELEHKQGWVPHYHDIHRKWPNPGHHDDELKYKPTDTSYLVSHIPYMDFLSFNGQLRDVGQTGGQGPMLWPMEDAEDKCDASCAEQAGGAMRAVRGGEGNAECHMVVYQDLDDMCDDCK